MVEFVGWIQFCRVYQIDLVWYIWFSIFGSLHFKHCLVDLIHFEDFVWSLWFNRFGLVPNEKLSLVDLSLFMGFGKLGLVAIKILSIE